MTIQLPEDLERFVQINIQTGRFASEDEAIAEAVRLLRQAEELKLPNGSHPATAGEPAWQRVLKSMQEVPDAVFDRIPVDGSEQLDHYIYGSPRLSNS